MHSYLVLIKYTSSKWIEINKIFKYQFCKLSYLFVIVSIKDLIENLSVEVDGYNPKIFKYNAY